MTWPSWTHEANCKQKDPINLIFDRELPDVGRELSANNWRDDPFEIFPWTHQFILINEGKQRQNKAKEKEGKPPRDPIPYPLGRYHIRLWSFGQSVVASAHYDVLSFCGHVPASFEAGKLEVERDFSNNWSISPNAIPLHNFKQNPFHNGYATRISK